MNETETNPPAPVEWNEQVAALQRQVFSLLLALIVVSGTLTVYLYRQASLTGKDIKSLRTQVIEPFKQKEPAMESFLNQLVAYGQTHADFRPVLVKYGINPTSAVPAAATAPKPAVPAKK
jgi:hypothetical protein